MIISIMKVYRTEKIKNIIKKNILKFYNHIFFVVCVYMFFSSSPLLFFFLNTFGIGKGSIDFEFIELLTNCYLDTQQKRAIEKVLSKN